MRERKMRYWNSFNNEMDYEPVHYTFDGEHVNVNMLLNSVEENGDEWSDWIGRQDDFGQDIYEGDYFQISDCEDSEVWFSNMVVVYDNVSASYIGIDGEGNKFGFFGIQQRFEIKVVGNRWEGLK